LAWRFRTGAVTRSYWSELFNRAPWDSVRDIEYVDPDDPISHGQFHTMAGVSIFNHATPSDADLYATLSMLVQPHQIDYGIYHSCTLDSMGHRVGHDCAAMDTACIRMEVALAHFLPLWQAVPILCAD